ncbi:NAD(P)/FAD-dependent oxidoreductase [Ruminococcaceae bacterium OttesenSCG-928-L11]|nr:NAD(P)/FAD-dependent oxidoreductase [Ruminococcaceae bacterium OttesenSCG-928-L11]
MEQGADTTARLDSVIIGSGPAGLEAALNLKIRQKDFLLFGAADLSNKITLAPRINNYLGLPGISGGDLAARFREHLEQMAIEIVPEQVTTVYPMGEYFSLATAHRTLEATTVILCPGVFNSKDLPGEAEFLGRGVGYCATCDAPLYRDRTVAIVGYTDESVEEANFVCDVAVKVYFVPGKAFTRPLDSRVEVVDDVPVEITGSGKVEQLILNNRTLAVDGVFLLRETIAPASLVPGLETENGFIKVDAAMQTNLPGCYAAGDCTGKPHQYMRAAGQGQTAALNAAAYIDIQKHTHAE